MASADTELSPLQTNCRVLSSEPVGFTSYRRTRTKSPPINGCGPVSGRCSASTRQPTRRDGIMGHQRPGSICSQRLFVFKPCIIGAPYWVHPEQGESALSPTADVHLPTRYGNWAGPLRGSCPCVCRTCVYGMHDYDVWPQWLEPTSWGGTESRAYIRVICILIV